MEGWLTSSAMKNQKEHQRATKSNEKQQKAMKSNKKQKLDTGAGKTKMGNDKQNEQQKARKVQMETRLNRMFLLIDDYAKDGGPGAVWPCCSVYHDPLRH